MNEHTNAIHDAYEIRRPEPQDASAIHGLVSACDIEVLGHPDMTLDDVADGLVEPDFDPARDGWLVYRRGESVPVGWTYAVRRGGAGNVDVEVYSAESEVTPWLWDTVLSRARQIAGGLGVPRAVADIAIYRQDEAKQALAKDYGFEPATGFQRLRIDHTEVEPGFLPGASVHPAADSEELMRAAHHIHQVGFADHFGFVPKEFDDWKADFESSSTHDWSQLLLAQMDGRPAAMLLGSDMFAADENCGYVRILSVLPEFRGRGLGRLLLKRAFAADARRGRVGTYLHVDSGNLTPALDLYLSVGMRPVLVMDVWRRALDAEVPA